MVSVRSSKCSSRKSIRLKIQAELDATRKLSELKKKQLEREKEKDEIEMALINKELELRKAEINEDYESSMEEEFDNKTEDPYLNTKEWVEQQRTDTVREKNVSGENDVIKALTKAVEALSSTRDDSKFIGMKHLLSRQMLNKDLPIFTGKCEEWPSFYIEFLESTETCELSKRENILRLRKCLKGEARDIVEGLMANPENTDEVIAILKSRYGQPQHILRNLIQKLKNTPPIKESQLETINKLAAVVHHIVENIKILDMDDQLTNIQTIDEVLNKIPYSWRIQWAESRNREKNLNLRSLSDWLMKRASLVNSVYAPISTNSVIEKRDQYKEYSKFKLKKETVLTTMDDHQRGTYTCSFCKEFPHQIQDCKMFAKASIEMKGEFVKKKGLCYSSLKRGHRTFKCRIRRKCEKDGCDKFHHHFLHAEDIVKNVISKEKATKEAPLHMTEQIVIHTTAERTKILLKIVPIYVTGSKGTIRTFALLDEASTVSLIEEELAIKIGLDGPSEPLRLRWMNEKSVEEIITSRKIHLRIRGAECKKEYNLKNVRTVPSLNLMPQTLNLKKLKDRWKHFQRMIVDYENAKPLILIGQDNWELIVSRKIIQGPKNSPALSWTYLGWIIHGRVNTEEYNTKEILLHIFEEDNLHKLVKESFILENFGIKCINSKEDKRAEEIMTNTARKINNRWEIGLPWKDEHKKTLPETYNAAFQRLKWMEKKMDKNEQLASEYCKKIEEYVEKGYARKLSEEEIENPSGQVWYLPHFGVINSNKPGKMRFVFDAAAKSYGLSLNDKLLKGPDLMANIISVIFNFRQKKFAFAADIKEMFHQVVIRKEDQDGQRFLWREMDRDRKPDVYVMQAMIFGAISSPYCAQYVKNRNAVEYSKIYPRACEAITKYHYVDDYLDSTHTVEEGIKLIQEVRQIHESGGFLLRNWLSNSEKNMENIPEELRSVKKEFKGDVDLDVHNERILGLLWNTIDDTFSFSTKFHKVDKELLENKRLPTKREILKIVMSVYDPLGFITHFVIRGRMMIQDVWRKQLAWDDQIDKELGKRWNRWINCLTSLNTLKIPRPYCEDMKDVHELQLHVFSDASEQAYSAVANIRCKCRNNIHVALVTSKARVTPLKGLSIPRAELQGAVLASRLA